MLGCVGSRDKTGLQPSTVQPCSILFQSRSADSISFEFCIQATTATPFLTSQVTCRFEFLEEGTFGSSWSILHNAKWRPAGTPEVVFEGDEEAIPAVYASSPGLGTAPIRLAGTVPAPGVDDAVVADETAPSEDRIRRMRCSVDIPDLKAEKTYVFRVLARSGEREQHNISNEVKFRTSERPMLEAGRLNFLGRTADSIEVSLRVADPEGAPISACEVQFRPDSMMSGWDSAMLDVCQSTGASSFLDSTESPLWKGTLCKLLGNTNYKMRARAQNAVGWSWEHTPDVVYCTSDKPDAPEQVVCLRRHPDSATLSFVVKDPDGAPVTSYTAFVHGAFGYSLHTQCKFRSVPAVVGSDGRYHSATRKGLCIVQGLQPDTEFCVRISSHNGVGSSRQMSQPVQFRTAKCPSTVGEASVQVGPKAFALTWEMQDPVGAPVVQLQLEYSADSVFSSWDTVDAKPVALLTESGDNVDINRLAAAVVVSRVTGASSVVRRWHVQIDNLERETGYQLRARARNSVGWSPTYSSTINTRTSDRPPQAYGVRCRSRHPTGVWLEATVDEVLGTSAVEGIAVEACGSFSWIEVQDVECKRSDGGAAPNKSNWSVFVPLGLTPGVIHELRLWAVNLFGRSSKPSLNCACKTSDKPKQPDKLTCIHRLPHSLYLEWNVPDPEGAPVRRFEVQYRSDQAFTSWHTAACADTQRQAPPRECAWRCVLEELDAMTTYRIVLRALNEVGWSDCSSEAAFDTSGLPQLTGPCPDVFRVTDPSAATAEAAMREASDATASADDLPGLPADGASFMVDLQLEDPDGAPVLACMMRGKDSGPWTLASRMPDRPSTAPQEGGRNMPISRWCAILPWLPDMQRCSVSVKAANAVGWSLTKDHRAIPIRRGIGRLQQAVSDLAATAEHTSLLEASEDLLLGSCSTLDLVSAEVRRTLVLQEEAQQRVLASLHEAASRHDKAYLTALSLHGNHLGQRIQVLQEVAQHLDPEQSAFGENHGAELTAQLQEAMHRQTLVQDAQKAATVLALLLQGYIWLETAWRTELLSMMSDIAKARNSIPESGGGVLMQWIAQSQAWSESFRAKVGEALPEGLARAAQLLATLASGRKLAQLEYVRADLEACLTLVSAAERQLRKLRHSHRILCAAEASKSHDFEHKGALKKIEATALGLVTMLVLPLPGTMELGALHIGMLWLSGDPSNSHIAVEHPTGQPLAAMLERLGSSPPPRSAVILAGWASGGHKGVVLVHNATARRITVHVLPGEQETFASKVGSKFAEAHPYVRGAAMAMSQKQGGDSVAVITPTDVALIQVPDQNNIRLEFSYGTSGHVEKAVGRASVCQGAAVSFMCLDGGVQISNSHGDNFVVEDSTIRVVNNDLTSVAVSLYRPVELRKHFESALSVTPLKPGEVKHLPLPQPCIGCIFELEVRREGRKCEYSEVRPGQCLVIDSAG